MALDRLMTQFEKEMELGTPLATEVRGIYALPLDEGLTVTIRELPEGAISFECSLADCPKTREEEYYSQLLLANLFGQGTKGAVLGLSDDGLHVILTQLIDYEVEFKEFQDLLEDFVNTVDFWREETQTHLQKQTP